MANVDTTHAGDFSQDPMLDRFVARLYKYTTRLIEARQREAMRRVAPYLAAVESDEQFSESIRNNNPGLRF